MTKAVAKLSLACIQIGLMLGNYWFTFGLWPRSWTAFTFFAISAITVTGLFIAIEQDRTTS